MRPALPHVAIGLACRLKTINSVHDLVQAYYSPLRTGVEQNREAALSSDETLIAVCVEAFADAGLKQIPQNTAIFVSLSEDYLNDGQIAFALQEHFQSNYSRDLTIMLYDSSEDSLAEALNWLDRGECDFALACSFDKMEGADCAAAVLLATANKANKLNSYANVQHSYGNAEHPALAQIASVQEDSAEDQDDACLFSLQTELSRFADLNVEVSAVSFIETCDARWLESAKLSSAFKQLRNYCSRASAEMPQKDAVWTKHDQICFASSLAMALSHTSKLITPLMAVISSCLALHQRVIPSSKFESYKLQLDNEKLPDTILQTQAARPWVHPVSPAEPAHPRRAYISLERQGILLSERGNDIDEITVNKLLKQSSELFVYSAGSREELLQELLKAQNNLSMLAQLPLWESAYLTNCVQRSNESKFALSIIAGTFEEFCDFLALAIEHLANSATKSIPTGSGHTGIYYSGEAASKPGKLAFVLAGLGAAYPNMLEDLCFYFPEIRQVFDFIERLALRAGDKTVPSRAIFPVAGSKQGSSPAMLATMDSAVITLILAQYAIYALLKKLDVNADVLIGCSTGEFTVMCMAEMVNLFQAAQTFYHLSTQVSRSVSVSQLANLKTIRVAASTDGKLKTVLDSMATPVYVGADLSETCVLISGTRDSIDLLSSKLKAESIEFLPLPVAVPYHTPLVAGKVSHESDEVQMLTMNAPSIESWSCSLASKYPESGAEIRKISTDLFEKTICLRQTIEKTYLEGSRIYVEAGPKGGLIPFISEVLKGKEHIALAADLQTRRGIDQFHVLLAKLIANGIHVNLMPLYHRRVDRDKFQLESLQVSNAIYQFMQWADNDLPSLVDLSDPTIAELANEIDQDLDPFVGDIGLPGDVMLTYLSTMQEFQQSLLNTQENLMLAYMQASQEEDFMRQYESISLPGSFAFIPSPALQSSNDAFVLQVQLDTNEHKFLLDHAIGGNVCSTEHSSRVHLLPLMVALEIMAEGASLIYPEQVVIRLRDIRAYKRIRCEQETLTLNLELRSSKENTVEARICTSDAEEDENNILASCVVEFDESLAAGPTKSEFSFDEARSSKLSPHSLYKQGSMFHGPRMQSVSSIDRVSRRSIEGTVDCRTADDWFTSQSVDKAKMVLDPLLLDNSSQFVLYQMYEHNIPAIALLPFHIDSIEFFEGYDGHYTGKRLHAQANLRSMTQRGTEARIELSNWDGQVLARVNDVSSRAILLSEKLENFIHDPAHFICSEYEIDKKEKNLAVSIINKSELPSDETTLDWLSDYILTPAEQSEWKRIGKAEKRRLDWICGRIAAKDAVRFYLRNYHGLKLKPADIEIRTALAGNAEAKFRAHISVDTKLLPQISISHSDSTAVAIAEAPEPQRFAGIDVEEIKERENGFIDLAFNKDELAWVNKLAVSEQARAIAVIWTAKEAAAKSHGTGFQGNPKFFEVIAQHGFQDVLQVKAKIPNDGNSGGIGSVYTCPVLVDESRRICIAYVRNFQGLD